MRRCFLPLLTAASLRDVLCNPRWGKIVSTGRATGEAKITSFRIARNDPRYRAILDKRFSKRFSASPDFVRLASSTDEVTAAVQEAVSGRHRLVVTSGGHCLEGFVSDPEVRVIIDRLADPPDAR